MRASLLSLVLLALQCLITTSSFALSPRDREAYFSNRPVYDQNGNELRFYDDVLKGRIVVVSFIYTTCKDICPLTTARLRQLADELGDRVGKKIFFAFLSVDPTNDTPERLKAYADAFNVGEGWTFLTGSLENMRFINGRFGERMRSLSEHRNEIMLGNDATGEWQRNSVFGDLTRLTMDVLAMDPDWRNRVRNASEDRKHNKIYELKSEPGQALYKKLCAGCHAFKVGDIVGPDLYGITARRSHDWLMAFIRDPEKLRRQKDATALALMDRFKGVRMPSLGLSEIDAADLISYLDTRTKWFDSQRAEAEASVAGTHHHGHQAPTSPQHSPPPPKHHH